MRNPTQERRHAQRPTNCHFAPNAHCNALSRSLSLSLSFWSGDGFSWSPVSWSAPVELYSSTLRCWPQGTSSCSTRRGGGPGVTVASCAARPARRYQAQTRPVWDWQRNPYIGVVEVGGKMYCRSRCHMHRVFGKGTSTRLYRSPKWRLGFRVRRSTC